MGSNKNSNEHFHGATQLLAFVWKNKQARIAEGGKEEGSRGGHYDTLRRPLPGDKRLMTREGPRSYKARSQAAAAVRRVMKDASQFPAAVMIRQIK